MERVEDIVSLTREVVDEFVSALPAGYRQEAQ
jgi:hypothetical protein